MRILLLLLCASVIASACKTSRNTGSASNQASDKSCIDPAKINPEQACLDVYKPVCGCDGLTYSNSCAAERMGVQRWVEGVCATDKSKADCIDPARINPDTPCPKIYKPVCGCDNKTYANECLAQKAGLKSWQPGKCAQ